MGEGLDANRCYAGALPHTWIKMRLTRVARIQAIREWYIIALICIEIALGLYDRFLARLH